jgi:hypothetical protein
MADDPGRRQQRAPIGPFGGCEHCTGGRHCSKQRTGALHIQLILASPHNRRTNLRAQSRGLPGGGMAPEALNEPTSGRMRQASTGPS